ncbi:reverse transcriptase domain-containing protein [Tanacetum coccineum]
MKLTQAPILVAPDWDLPFEIMCDASDFVVGAVLGQLSFEKKEITEIFPLETLGMVTFRGDDNAPWFADFANYHAGNFVIKGMSSQQKRKFFKDASWRPAGVDHITVTKFPYGTVELFQNSAQFQSGMVHRLRKHYFWMGTYTIGSPDLQTFPMDTNKLGYGSSIGRPLNKRFVEAPHA